MIEDKIKIIDIGNLPDTSSKTLDIGLVFDDSTCILEKMEGIIEYPNNIKTKIPTEDGSIVFYIKDSNKLAIVTQKDESLATGKVILYYKEVK